MEQIHYDDAPADTAAFCWLCTKLGVVTVRRATEHPEAMIRRAFRAGWLSEQRENAKPPRRREGMMLNNKWPLPISGFAAFLLLAFGIPLVITTIVLWVSVWLLGR